MQIPETHENSWVWGSRGPLRWSVLLGERFIRRIVIAMDRQMVGDLRRVCVSEAEFWSLLIGLRNGGLMPDGQ